MFSWAGTDTPLTLGLSNGVRAPSGAYAIQFNSTFGVGLSWDAGTLPDGGWVALKSVPMPGGHPYFNYNGSNNTLPLLTLSHDAALAAGRGYYLDMSIIKDIIPFITDLLFYEPLNGVMARVYDQTALTKIFSNMRSNVGWFKDLHVNPSGGSPLDIARILIPADVNFPNLPNVDIQSCYNNADYLSPFTIFHSGLCSSSGWGRLNNLEPFYGRATGAASMQMPNTVWARVGTGHYWSVCTSSAACLAKYQCFTNAGAQLTSVVSGTTGFCVSLFF
jgi:hypothetical protein